mgnify:CR=1 FL=1
MVSPRRPVTGFGVIVSAPGEPFREFIRAVAVDCDRVDDGEAAALRDALLSLVRERGAITTAEAENAMPGNRKDGRAARLLGELEASGWLRMVTGRAPLGVLAEAMGRPRWAANARVWTGVQA